MTLDLGLLVGIFLFLSVSLNILLIWFLLGLTSRLVLVSDNMSDLLDYIVQYGSSLKSVYEMELYYGDETIRGLVQQTQVLLEVLSDFEEIYAVTDDEEMGDEEQPEEEDLDGDETESPQEDTSQTQVQRKAVFYSGP